MRNILLNVLIPLLLILGGFLYLRSVGEKMRAQTGGNFFEVVRNNDPTSSGSQHEQNGSTTDSSETNNTASIGQSSDDADEDIEVNQDDLGPIGSRNHDYLQSDPFSNLVIEIDHVDGRAPSDIGRRQAERTFRAYADKPDGLSYAGGNSIQSQGDVYNYNQIIEIIDKNRSQYTSGSTASLYILFLDGEFQENTSALGAALNATTFVIFKDKIEDATTAIIHADEIERAVVAHEVGHLWGLININYESEIDHEHPDSPNHSDNHNSVMFWAVEDVSVANVLRGSPSYQFDSADRQDIERIKSGEY